MTIKKTIRRRGAGFEAAGGGMLVQHKNQEIGKRL
jgi:hypothetical protein